MTIYCYIIIIVGKRGGTMFTQLEIKNNLLNVTQLQEKADQIVFDYIDTSQNWGKAYKGLNNLFQQTILFYDKYVNTNGIPKANVYWSLFLDVVGRLIYFKTLAERHVTDLQTDEDVENIIEGYVVAANCLSNVNVNNEHELLDEICESFEEIRFLDGEKGKFKQSIVKKDGKLEDSLAVLFDYTTKLAYVHQHQK